jgi:hypothetical protein
MISLMMADAVVDMVGLYIMILSGGIGQLCKGGVRRKGKMILLITCQ